MLEVKIRLFGAFRKYGNGSELELQIPPASSIPMLRETLVKHLLTLNPDFKEVELVKDSALATENEILHESSKIEHNCRLALLPPVCGG